MSSHHNDELPIEPNSESNPNHANQANEINSTAQKTENASTENTPPQQSQVADLQKKADDNWDKYLRTQAELDNLRRRAARDVENAHKYAIEQFCKELLVVKDSLELGLKAGETIDVEKLREGSELTLKEFDKIMSKFGIEEINPEGEKFNPEHHQAMVTQPSTQIEPNHVLAVYQKGYLLNKRLLRPAMVVVSQKAQN